MKRREFLGVLGGAAAWPLAASAQQSQPMRRIGHLRAGLPPERELQAFLRGLPEVATCRDRITCWSHNGGTATLLRLPELAVALVNEAVYIIVTEGTISVRAAHAVTGTIPIVFTRAADPFVFGLIKNLSRPGGNITGFSSLNVDIAGKTSKTLKGIVFLSKVAILAPRQVWDLFSAADNAAARSLGSSLSTLR